jgi:hypothetical protein
MPAPLWWRPQTTIDLNHLRPGTNYRAATTAHGSVVGEYLGIEVAYDVWSILLRTGSGTVSIPVYDLVSVRPEAA